MLKKKEKKERKKEKKKNSSLFICLPPTIPLPCWVPSPQKPLAYFLFL